MAKHAEKTDMEKMLEMFMQMRQDDKARDERRELERMEREDRKEREAKAEKLQREQDEREREERKHRGRRKREKKRGMTQQVVTAAYGSSAYASPYNICQSAESPNITDKDDIDIFLRRLEMA